MRIYYLLLILNVYVPFNANKNVCEFKKILAEWKHLKAYLYLNHNAINLDVFIPPTFSFKCIYHMKIIKQQIGKCPYYKVPNMNDSITSFTETFLPYNLITSRNVSLYSFYESIQNLNDFFILPVENTYMSKLNFLTKMNVKSFMDNEKFETRIKNKCILEDILIKNTLSPYKNDGLMPLDIFIRVKVPIKYSPNDLFTSNNTFYQAKFIIPDHTNMDNHLTTYHLLETNNYKQFQINTWEFELINAFETSIDYKLLNASKIVELYIYSSAKQFTQLSSNIICQVSNLSSHDSTKAHSSNFTSKTSMFYLNPVMEYNDEIDAESSVFNSTMYCGNLITLIEKKYVGNLMNDNLLDGVITSNFHPREPVGFKHLSHDLIHIKVSCHPWTYYKLLKVRRKFEKYCLFDSKDRSFYDTFVLDRIYPNLFPSLKQKNTKNNGDESSTFRQKSLTSHLRYFLTWILSNPSNSINQQSNFTGKASNNNLPSIKPFTILASQELFWDDDGNKYNLPPSSSSSLLKDLVGLRNSPNFFDHDLKVSPNYLIANITTYNTMDSYVLNLALNKSYLLSHSRAYDGDVDQPYRLRCVLLFAAPFVDEASSPEFKLMDNTLIKSASLELSLHQFPQWSTLKRDHFSSILLPNRILDVTLFLNNNLILKGPSSSPSLFRIRPGHLPWIKRPPLPPFLSVPTTMTFYVDRPTTNNLSKVPVSGEMRASGSGRPPFKLECGNDDSRRNLKDASSLLYHHHVWFRIHLDNLTQLFLDSVSSTPKGNSSLAYNYYLDKYVKALDFLLSPDNVITLYKKDNSFSDREFETRLADGLRLALHNVTSPENAATRPSFKTIPDERSSKNESSHGFLRMIPDRYIDQQTGAITFDPTLIFFEDSELVRQWSNSEEEYDDQQQYFWIDFNGNFRSRFSFSSFDDSAFVRQRATVFNPYGHSSTGTTKFSAKLFSPPYLLTCLTFSGNPEDGSIIFKGPSSHLTYSFKVKTPLEMDDSNNNPLLSPPTEEKPGPIFKEVKRGATVRLKCSGTGLPPPRVTWLKNGEPLVTAGRVNIIRDPNSAKFYGPRRQNALKKRKKKIIARLLARLLPVNATNTSIIEASLSALYDRYFYYSQYYVPAPFSWESDLILSNVQDEDVASTAYQCRLTRAILLEQKQEPFDELSQRTMMSLETIFGPPIFLQLLQSEHEPDPPMALEILHVTSSSVYLSWYNPVPAASTTINSSLEDNHYLLAYSIHYGPVINTSINFDGRGEYSKTIPKLPPSGSNYNNTKIFSSLVDEEEKESLATLFIYDLNNLERQIIVENDRSYCLVEDLKPGTTYYLYMESYNSHSASKPSLRLTFTTTPQKTGFLLKTNYTQPTSNTGGRSNYLLNDEPYYLKLPPYTNTYDTSNDGPDLAFTTSAVQSYPPPPLFKSHFPVIYASSAFDHLADGKKTQILPQPYPLKELNTTYLHIKTEKTKNYDVQGRFNLKICLNAFALGHFNDTIYDLNILHTLTEDGNNLDVFSRNFLSDRIIEESNILVNNLSHAYPKCVTMKDVKESKIYAITLSALNRSLPTNSGEYSVAAAISYSYNVLGKWAFIKIPHYEQSPQIITFNNLTNGRRYPFYNNNNQYVPTSLSYRQGLLPEHEEGGDGILLDPHVQEYNEQWPAPTSPTLYHRSSKKNVKLWLNIFIALSALTLISLTGLGLYLLLIRKRRRPLSASPYSLIHFWRRRFPSATSRPSTCLHHPLTSTDWGGINNQSTPPFDLAQSDGCDQENLSANNSRLLFYQHKKNGLLSLSDSGKRVVEMKKMMGYDDCKRDKGNGQTRKLFDPLIPSPRMSDTTFV